MIQEKSGRDTGVSELWEERFIQGFISKQEAETLLLQAPEPMMLIRFSDNQLAGLSIVCLNPYTREIDHLRPFKFKEEIEKLTLPAMIVNCQEVKDINIIFPDKPREKHEDKVAASKRMEEPDTASNYKTRTLVMTSSGDKSLGGRTPAYSPSPSPAQFVPRGKISDTTPPPNQFLHPQFPRTGIKMENSRSPIPNYGNGMTDIVFPDEFVQMQHQGGQFEDIDEQMMQGILSDLAKNDDEENDMFVHMVQAFEITAQNNDARGTGSTPQPQYAYGANSSNANFDFDMA